MGFNSGFKGLITQLCVCRFIYKILELMSVRLTYSYSLESAVWSSRN